MKFLSLEKLDGLTGLAGLTDRTGVDTRPILLRVLTDLYIQKPSHTPEESRHYTELALRLIDVVDAQTCATVIEKLKIYPGAPQEVLQRLEAACQQKPSQDDGASDPWLEDDLGIFEPAPAKPQREATPLSPEDYIARRDAFFEGGEDERRALLLDLDYPDDIEAVPLAADTGILRFLEQAALAGRFQEFTTLLQQSLGTSRALTSRIIADPHGEPFAIAAKALAVPADTFQRILMFLNPSIGRSVDHVYRLSDLFEEMSLAAALQMVAIWRSAERLEARSAAHASLYGLDAGPRRREQSLHEQPRHEDQLRERPLTRRSSQ